MRTIPRRAINIERALTAAIKPPIIAPGVVAVSRSRPSFILFNRILVYMPAAVHELATMATRLLAMATLIGRWRATVSMGTTIKPPPTPNIEPSKPATNPTPPNAQKFTSFKIVIGHGIIGHYMRSIIVLAVIASPSTEGRGNLRDCFAALLL